MSKIWLSQRAACIYASIGHDTLKKWVLRGWVREWKVPGTARGLRYSREDIDAVIERNMTRPREGKRQPLKLEPKSA